MAQTTQPTRSELEDDVQRARALARFMDSQLSIGGIEVGADAIIGLVPGIGDTITSVIACYPIYLARKHDLGKDVQLQMAGNVALDWLVGLIPVAGDIFDVAFKANLKNVRILEEAIRRRDGAVVVKRK